MDYQFEYEKLQDELKIYRNINQTAMLSWWKINFTTKTYDCSEVLRRYCEFEEGDVSFDDFRAIIHPDYRERIVRNGMLFSLTGVYEEKFQIKTIYGYRWVSSKLGKKEVTASGDIVAYGYVRLLDDLEVELLGSDSADQQIKISLDKYNAITSSLIYLLNNSDTKNAINQILRDVMRLFNGDRTYIYEFNEEEKTQKCTYEVTSRNIGHQSERFKDIPLTDIPWWTDQIKKRIPIILNTIDDLPAEAYVERNILSQQDIRSILVVPLTSDEKSFGYIGIDIVERMKVWSNVDKEWLISLANIISMCIKLKGAIETSKREHKRFSDLYENMPMGVIRIRLIYDESGKPLDYLYVEANQCAEKIAAINFSQYIGQLAKTYGDDVDGDRLSFFDDIIKGQGVVSDTKYVVGNNRHFAYTAYPVGGNELILIFHDNTDNILTHRDLEKNKSKLNNIFQNVPIGIEIYDRNGVLVDINDADLAMFGISREAVVGKVNLFENPNVPERYLVDLRNGKNINFEIKYSHSNINKANYYRTNLDGYKLISVQSSILYDSDGYPDSTILVVVDNTEKKDVKNRLEEFELIFSSIAEFSGIGLCRYNSTNRTFIATDQWYNNICKEKSSVSNLYDAYSNIGDVDKEYLIKNFDDMEGGLIDNFRLEIKVHSDSGDKWLRSYYKVSKRNDLTKETELVGLNIDITELKMTEFKLIEAKMKAEESDRLKSAFVSNMSHEIRTPLNAIVGFSEMLVDSTDMDERQQYITIIRQNNDLLIQLISDILDISKIESGTMSVILEEVDVNYVCRNIVNSNAIKANKGVELLFDRHVDVCMLNTDRMKLTQILTNFVSNAIKFTNTGSIKLGYNIECDTITFYVKDTGIGISKNDLENIFDRFTKLNSFAQGSGLGLSICKSLAQRVGGVMSVESIEGEGSCFMLSFQYKKSTANMEHNEILKNIVTNQNGDNSGHKPTILIAEDRDSNYMLVSAILKKDYSLVRACNGKEAVELYHKFSPDIILMDMRMPIMDGEEATTEIRKFNTTLPIIAVTAFAFDQDRKRVMDLGCNDYISKPINAVLLKNMITKWLHK